MVLNKRIDVNENPFLAGTDAIFLRQQIIVVKGLGVVTIVTKTKTHFPPRKLTLE